MKEMDKVDLYDTEIKASAAAGELAIAKIAAAPDSVSYRKERKTLQRCSKKCVTRFTATWRYMASGY